MPGFTQKGSHNLMDRRFTSLGFLGGHHVKCPPSERAGDGHPGLCVENGLSSFPGPWCIESVMFMVACLFFVPEDWTTHLQCSVTWASPFVSTDGRKSRPAGGQCGWPVPGRGGRGGRKGEGRRPDCLGPHAHLQRTSAARASVERFREP